jgi:hypothetical protein
MGGRWRLALAATALFALTACGGNSGSGDEVASLNGGDKKENQQAKDDGKSDQDKMREFAKCMREHGVDMPDPDADGGIRMHAAGPADATEGVAADGANGDKMQKADDACKSLLPNGGKPKPLSPEDLDKMRQQAKCMREHGVDMPDPDPNNPGMAISLGDGKDPAALDKAFKECGMGVAAPGVRAEAPVGGGGK